MQPEVGSFYYFLCRPHSFIPNARTPLATCELAFFRMDVALATLAAIVGMGAGYYSTPGEVKSNSMTSKVYVRGILVGIVSGAAVGMNWMVAESA